MKSYAALVISLSLFIATCAIALGKNWNPLPVETECTSSCHILSDSVNFHYYSDGKKVGYSRYIVSERGELVNSFALAMDNIEYHGLTQVKFDEKGMWKNLHYVNNGNEVKFIKKGDQILISTSADERYIQDRSDGNILEDMTPALIQNLMNKYSKSKSGKVSFDAFFVPGIQITGELVYKGSLDLTIHGKALSCDHYRLDLAPVYKVDVICLASMQILMLYYEAQNGAFIKEGYEELLSLDGFGVY